ncbi:hypothetical protein D1B31_11140 [Neobacillus notoginsengisoli]|uniref:Uncharacterized protein n=1 Tax=Neobacillus notoginsengisoli TaxID=1578198 RepID=A0A417YUD2_9BACI|nr:hypothetical protein [Neobacillus notoginsengisoli]RHW40738.1 hypothetical protein D1B31_11140 [Neobacillus notoginsengisoli]
MRKNRLLLCLLLTLFLIYYAGPRLPIDSGMAGFFTVVWTSFAILVAAGNIAGIVKARGSIPVHPAGKKQRRPVRSRSN